MTRARGNQLQNTLAKYLSRWWVHAESAGAGRNGRDILGTPGVFWENKTSGARLRPGEWVRDTTRRVQLGEIPIVVYWPPGTGEKSPEHAIVMMYLPFTMTLLELAGVTPSPSPVPTPTPTLAPPPALSPAPAPTPPPTASPSPSTETPPTHAPAASPPPSLRLIKGDPS